MNKRKKQLNFILIILILIVLTGLFLFSRFTGFASKENYVKLSFYDEFTNCSLNGYLFIGDKMIGKTVNGTYKLSMENYNENLKNVNQKISLFGKLGNCFSDSFLYFDKSWENIKIETYYFNGFQEFAFKTKVNPNTPVKRELLGFIQLDNVRKYINYVEIRNNLLEDLSRINIYLSNKINYTNDSIGVYWQTPEETLTTNKGICNDYSTSLLSLFLAYNPSLKCYNIVLTDHVTTFCNIEKNFIYYDQKEKEVNSDMASLIDPNDIRSRLSYLNKRYLSEYGLNYSEKFLIAFNDKEYIEFNTEQEYLDWQYSLIVKDIRTNLLIELEKESSGLDGYNNDLEQNMDDFSYLPSLKQNPDESPSLRGFFQEYSIVLMILFLILIVLIIAIIRINRK